MERKLDRQKERIHRRVMDIASNVAVKRKDLPGEIHIMTYDEESGLMFGAYAGVDYLDRNDGTAQITRTSIGVVREGASVLDVAKSLVKNHPGVPLVCDQTIADRLSDANAVSIADDHYRLELIGSGTLEVFIAYPAKSVQKRMLPPGVSGQIYT